MLEKDLTFRVTDFVGQYLQQNPGLRITAHDLARAIVQAHPVEAEYKRKASTQDLDDAGLIKQVRAEIGAAAKGIVKKFERIVITEDSPRLFYWDDRTSQTISEVELEDQAETPRSEHTLYPILREYLQREKYVYSMRIDEKKSSGKGGAGSSRWLHPDLAGIQLLSQTWGKGAQTLAKYYNNELIKIWSFEVKISLSIANVRSSYFQAVSNSSWSHFGYLVAERIDQRALEELEILASAHGIGVLLLNSDEVGRSSVLIPAQERTDINWNSVNRLATENKDFASFLKGLERLHQTGDIQLVGKQFESSFID